MDDKPRHGATHPLKAQADKEIAEHLALHGGKNWKPLIERYTAQGIHEQTVWRWIRLARKADAPKPTLTAARARIAEVIGDAPSASEMPPNAAELGQHLPAAPSPAYIAKAGDRGMRNLDILRELESVYGDALMLRAAAVKMVSDPVTGAEVEGIKNPVLFEKQMVRRVSVMETAIKAMGEVWNMRQMQEFYEVIVQEIGRADPQTQQRIMQRLAALNARTGMTMAMPA
jgi:hypothetical protein